MRKFLLLIPVLTLFSCSVVYKITKEEYSQIRVGMRYYEVENIIGAAGEETARTSMAGTTTVIYQWVNSNGSNAQLMFQNGELISIAQHGL